jgi:hypothetical protein
MDWAGVWGSYLDSVSTDDIDYTRDSWRRAVESQNLMDNPKDFQTSYGDMLAGMDADKRWGFFDKTMDDMGKRIGYWHSGEKVAGKFSKALGIDDSEAESKKQGLFDYMTGNIENVGGQDLFVDPHFGTIDEAGPFTEAGFGLADEGGQYDHLFE